MPNGARTWKWSRGRDALVVAVAGLLIALFSAGCYRSYHVISRERHAQAEQDARRTLASFEAHANRMFDYADSYLRSMRAYYLQNGLGEPLERFLKEIRAPHAESFSGIVSILDRDGNIVFRSDKTANELSSYPSMKGIDHFQYWLTHERDELYVGATRRGKVSGALDFRIARPLQRNGVFDGEIVLTMLPEHLLQFYDDIRLGPRSSASMWTLEPKLIARRSQLPAGDEQYDQVMPEIKRPIAEGHGERHVVSVVDKVRRFIIYKRLTVYPLFISVGVSDEDVEESLSETRTNLSLLAWAFAVFAALVCTLVLRQLRQNRTIAQASALLEQSEQRFRRLFHEAPLPLCFVNKDGVLVDINARFVHVFGYTREDVPTLDAWWQRAYPDPVYRAWVCATWNSAVVNATANGSDIKPSEYNVTTKSGAVRTVVISGIILGKEFLSTFFDITERKRVEDELRRHKDHLEEMVRERTLSLEAAMGQARAANQAKSTFLANMSHELRTPLTSVIGFSQLMAADQELNEDQKRKLAIINRSGNHLLTLINDVLTLSKIEAGRTSLDELPTDLAALVEAVVEMIRGRAEQKGLSLIVHCAGLSSWVMADGIKLRQILLNLLSNAVKFTPRGQIWLNAVGTPTENGRLSLDVTVTDTGVGIDSENTQRVFEPFAQAGAGDAQSGTGLGLSISQQFVQMMGGDIVLHSQPGQGSVFRFTITLDPCDAPPDHASASGAVVGIDADGARRILVAEDNPDVRLLLGSVLAPLGFVVTEVVDGAAALAAVEKDPPHLVIMDWRMPEMDGVEATRRIRALKNIRQPRIVILTASAFEEQRLITMEAGADDFLRKPFDQSDLLGVLERHLEIRFRRHQAVVSAVPAAEAVLAPEDVAILPQPARSALAEAVRELNQAKLIEALATVDQEHPEIVARIKALADGAKYRELWQMLKDEEV